MPAGHGPKKEPRLQAQVVHRQAVPSAGSAHHECSTPQACPAAAADDGQSVATESGSQFETSSGVVSQPPFWQTAGTRQPGPRGSSPYSHRAPSVAHAVELVGQDAGQGAAWGANEDGQTLGATSTATSPVLASEASGEVARAITGHVTQRMTEHYSHVDVGEKKAAVEGMLKLVQGGRAEAANETRKHQRVESGQAHFQAHAPANRHIEGDAARRTKKSPVSPGG